MSGPINLNQVSSVLTEMDTITNSDAVQSNPMDMSATQSKSSLEERLTWLSDIVEDEESKIDWICEGLFGRGLVTILSGMPKDGKTTFITHLLLAMENNSDFLGLEVKNTKTLIVTEETKASWHQKKVRARLNGQSVGIIPRYWYDRNHRANWEKGIEELRDLCLKEEIGLVFIDTISYFWTITSENDATEVTNTLKPLHLLTNAGIALILVHHDRKAGGSNVKGVRGSTALTGFPDIILGLTKLSDKSVLTGDGRYEETPSKLSFRLSDDESHFELLESSQPTNVTQEQKLDDILSYIPLSPEGLTRAEITQKWVDDKGVSPPNPSTVSRWLALGESKGLVEVVGHSDQRGKAELWGRVDQTANLEDNFEPTV